jgi:hypothetical protein
MVGRVSLEQDFCVWDRVTTQDSPTGVGDTRFAQLIVIGDMKPFVRLRFLATRRRDKIGSSRVITPLSRTQRRNGNDRL